MRQKSAQKSAPQRKFLTFARAILAEFQNSPKIGLRHAEILNAPGGLLN
jgi:hypothetical protein